MDEFILGDIAYKAIYFAVELPLLADRLYNRRTCGSCGAIYNLMVDDLSSGVCARCGTKGSISQRKDDNVSTVKARLKIFESTIGPLLNYYREKKCLQQIDASLGLDEVFEQLRRIG